MVQVNLLPDIVLNRRREAQIRKVAASVFVGWVALVVVATAGSLLIAAVRSAQLKSAVSTYNTKYQQVNSPDNVKFRQEALEVQTSLNNLSQLFNQQATLTDLLTRVSQLTPVNVTIKTLQFTTGGKVAMQVTTTSYAEAAEFVSALKATKAPDTSYPALPSSASSQSYFDAVSIDGATQSQNIVNVSISATYHSVSGAGGSQ